MGDAQDHTGERKTKRTKDDMNAEKLEEDTRRDQATLDSFTAQARTVRHFIGLKVLPRPPDVLAALAGNETHECRSIQLPCTPTINMGILGRRVKREYW